LHDTNTDRGRHTDYYGSRLDGGNDSGGRRFETRKEKHRGRRINIMACKNITIRFPEEEAEDIRRDLQTIAKLKTEQTGFQVSMNQVARKALLDYIDQELTFEAI
jgi:hypothetical protein